LGFEEQKTAGTTPAIHSNAIHYRTSYFIQ
jgi:hypothetical protein